MHVNSKKQEQWISIHPMLKFIHNKVALDIHKYDFNTSHVKVYLKHSKNDCDSVRISIHPMLKFIHRVVQPQNNIGLDFNTSHVKVYLIRS